MVVKAGVDLDPATLDMIRVSAVVLRGGCLPIPGQSGSGILPLAMIATRFIRSFLFGIAPFDPAGIGAAILIMAAASAVAGYLPALRAARVDPMMALKYE